MIVVKNLLLNIHTKCLHVLCVCYHGPCTGIKHGCIWCIQTISDVFSGGGINAKRLICCSHHNYILFKTSILN